MRILPKNSHGFSLTEMLVIIGVLGTLTAIALPMFHSTRVALSLQSGTEEVSSFLSRVRWMAVTSGSTRVVTAPSSSELQVETGDGTRLGSVDLSSYHATVSVPDGGITFDSRGFLSPLGTVNVTLTSTRGETTTVTVSPLGRVGKS